MLSFSNSFCKLISSSESAAIIKHEIKGPNTSTSDKTSTSSIGKPQSTGISQELQTSNEKSQEQPLPQNPSSIQAEALSVGDTSITTNSLPSPDSDSLSGEIPISDRFTSTSPEPCNSSTEDPAADTQVPASPLSSIATSPVPERPEHTPPASSPNEPRNLRRSLRTGNRQPKPSPANHKRPLVSEMTSRKRLKLSNGRMKTLKPHKEIDDDQDIDNDGEMDNDKAEPETESSSEEEDLGSDGPGSSMTPRFER